MKVKEEQKEEEEKSERRNRQISGVFRLNKVL